MNYKAIVPFAGYCEVSIEAENETDAIKKALEKVSIKDCSLVEFPTHENDDLSVYDLEILRTDVMDIDYSNIKGFSKMSKHAQKLFVETYKKQTNSMDYKAKLKWLPVKVAEHKDCIKVYFTNSEWLHYYANGTWG